MRSLGMSSGSAKSLTGSVGSSLRMVTMHLVSVRTMMWVWTEMCPEQTRQSRGVEVKAEG